MGNNIGPNYYEGMKKDIASCSESDPKKRADLCETKEHAGSLWDNYDAVQQNGSRLGEAFKTGREGTYKVVYDNGTSEYIDTKNSSVFNGEQNASYDYNGLTLHAGPGRTCDDLFSSTKYSSDVEDARYRGSFEEGSRAIEMDNGQTVLVSPNEGTTEVFDKDGTLNYSTSPGCTDEIQQDSTKDDINFTNDKKVYDEQIQGYCDDLKEMLSDGDKKVDVEFVRDGVFKATYPDGSTKLVDSSGNPIKENPTGAKGLRRMSLNDLGKLKHEQKAVLKDLKAEAARLEAKAKDPNATQADIDAAKAARKAANDQAQYVYNIRHAYKDVEAKANPKEEPAKTDDAPKTTGTLPPEPGSEKERVGRHTFYNPM